MVKINLLIADEDELYCERLSKYFLSKKLPVNLNTATSKKHLGNVLGMNHFDVIVISETFLTPVEVQTFLEGQFVLINSEDPSGKEEKYIHKYSRTEDFVKEIFFKYAEKTGNRSFIANSSGKNHIFTVYSPSGGCGKTSVALALANALSARGSSVLYLSMEQFGNSQAIFGKEEKGGFSDILLLMKQNAAHTVFALQRNIQVEPQTGIKYFSSCESIYELSEISPMEVSQLIDEVSALKDIDYIVIDTDSVLNPVNIKVLEKSDQILLVMTETDVINGKIKCFMNEGNIHNEINLIWNRSIPVFNKVKDPGTSQIKKLISPHGQSITIPILETRNELSLLEYARIYLNRYFGGFADEIIAAKGSEE